MNMEVGTSSSSSSGLDPCPICLGPILQPSFLDKCFHEFCYNCILQWTNVVSGKRSCPSSYVKCPLCKIENASIIHGWDGNSFQRHYIDQAIQNSFQSKAHLYRLKCYYTEQVDCVSSGSVDDIFNVSRYWKSRKYLQQNRWLENWLKRELQVLMQEEDVNIVMHHILGVIDSSLKEKEQKQQTKTPETKQKEFKDTVCEAARPFLAARTERFVNEVELFLASGLNIEAYDAVYLQRLGCLSPGIPSVAGEGESIEQTPVISYYYIFDEDSDASN